MQGYDGILAASYSRITTIGQCDWAARRTMKMRDWKKKLPVKVLRNVQNAQSGKTVERRKR